MFKKYKNDILFISVILIIALIFTFFINIFGREGKYIIVSIDGEIYEEYELSANTTVSLPTGNTLVIEDNAAYISDSTCRDKICVNHNSISMSGESIICLPHKLVIEVKEGR